MKIAFYATVWLILALFAGCQSLGLAEPKSLSQRIAYAYGTNAGIRTAAANSLTAGAISVADGEYVLKVTDETRTLLDASHTALLGGDPSTAEGRLLLALGVLDTLQTYLNRRLPE